jgi:hypothetical protein
MSSARIGYRTFEGEAGNVGLGTTAPTHLLHLYSTQGGDNTYETAGILLQNAGSNEVGIAFQTATTGNNAWAIGVQSNASWLGIAYGAQGDLIPGTNVQMALTTDGLVGIGLTNPSAQLDVAGVVKSSLGYYVGNTEVIDKDGNMVVRNIQVQDANGNSALFVDATGNVGMGTEAPTHKLHVFSTSGTNNDYEPAGILLENAGTGEAALAIRAGAIPATSAWFVGVNSNQTRLDVGYGLQMNQLDDAAVDMTLLPDGNVGVGTTNPANKLEVAGNARVTKLLLRDFTLTNFDINLPIDGRIGNTGTDRGHLAWTRNGLDVETLGQNIIFRTDGSGVISSERMRVTTTGSVGIGTTCPTHKLHVWANNTNENEYEAAGLLLENAGIGEAGLAIRTGAMSGGSAWFMGANYNSTRLNIGYGAQTNQIADGDVDLAILTDGNVGIGTTNPASRLHVTDNVLLGKGMVGAANSLVGGPFILQQAWDAAGATHTLAFPSYCMGNNSAGTLHIQTTNKLSTASRKMGTMQLAFIKLPGDPVSFFQTATQQTDNLTTFTATVGNTSNIVINTDSDCSICWTSIGSY